MLGTDPNKKVTSKDIVDLTEHVLLTLTLKNGNRIQCISQAKNSEYIDALKGRKVYYPYRPKTPNELDEDNGDDNDLPEMRDWKFDSLGAVLDAVEEAISPGMQLSTFSFS